MKKSIFKLVVLFIIIGSHLTYSQVYLSWGDVETARFGKETIYKSKEDNKPLNGPYKISETSGAYADITFKNGKIDGSYISFDFAGNKESEVAYVDGKAEGKNTAYFQNGKVESESFYKNSEKIGTWKTFNKKGEIISTENYKEGAKEGKWTRTLRNPSENTTSIVTEYYKNDKPTGNWEERYTDGQLLWEEIYSAPTDYIKKTYHRNGKLAEERYVEDRKKNGITSFFTPEGILEFKLNYDNDTVVYKEAYYENGILESKTSYKFGTVNGLYQRFSEEGIKIKEGQYKDTYKDGVWKIYDKKKGRLISEISYANDNENGDCTFYNKAKTPSLKGQYLNGKKDGVWKEFDLAGDLVKETEYDKGKQVSEKSFN